MQEQKPKRERETTCPYQGAQYRNLNTGRVRTPFRTPSLANALPKFSFSLQNNMSAVGKAVGTKLDWAKVISTLGLTGKTASTLTAFKKRNDDAKKEHLSLTEKPATIDFDHYKSVLSNANVINEVEKAVNGFKPVTYDVSKTIKTIEMFEQKAVENAKLTEKSVMDEVTQLQQTLKDIEGSRPFDQLTVDDVAKARPDLEDKVNFMIKNGKWNVPGYKEKFGDLTAM